MIIQVCTNPTRVLYFLFLALYFCCCITPEKLKFNHFPPEVTQTIQLLCVKMKSWRKNSVQWSVQHWSVQRRNVTKLIYIRTVLQNNSDRVIPLYAYLHYTYTILQSNSDIPQYSSSCCLCTLDHPAGYTVGNRCCSAFIYNNKLMLRSWKIV